MSDKHKKDKRPTAEIDPSEVPSSSSKELAMLSTMADRQLEMAAALDVEREEARRFRNEQAYRLDQLQSAITGRVDNLHQALNEFIVEQRRENSDLRIELSKLAARVERLERYRFPDEEPTEPSGP